MKEYNIICFDLDGTLSDPERGLIQGFIYAFKRLGLDYSDKQKLRKYIGPSLFLEWQEDFGFTPDEANYAIELVREYYNIYGWWDNDIYDGVREMLAELKKNGKKIVLATSKPLDTAKSILKLLTRQSKRLIKKAACIEQTAIGTTKLCVPAVKTANANCKYSRL